MAVSGMRMGTTGNSVVELDSLLPFWDEGDSASVLIRVGSSGMLAQCAAKMSEWTGKRDTEGDLSR